MKLATACPKPKKKPKPPLRFSSIKEKSYEDKLKAVKQLRSHSPLKRTTKPLRNSNSIKSAKRKLRNREYYASAEWRSKKKAVHQRDEYQCVEIILTPLPTAPSWLLGSDECHLHRVRCPNRGEVVNGKQTAKGLVAEEKSYGHRGTPGAIDRIVTRCKDCDRRLTPLERANHVGGFRK